MTERVDLHAAAALLSGGGLVVIPTETVYGLAADAGKPVATNDDAVRRIYTVKARAPGKPLPVLVGGLEEARELCTVPPEGLRLIKQFWPGPLTLVLPLHSDTLSPLVTAGLPTVALRCPAHPAALALLKLVNRPLALTSANRSGQPAPVRAEDVDLPGIDGMVDGGPCSAGIPSAIVDVTGETPVILRQGSLSAADLGL